MYAHPAPAMQVVPIGGSTFHNGMASFGEQMLLLTSQGIFPCLLWRLSGWLLRMLSYFLAKTVA
jgi:hypothetical protein